jgi:hypothetical protein
MELRMNILPGADFGFLVHTGDLEQVCLGRYTLVRKFPRLTIAIMTPYTLTGPEGKSQSYHPELSPEGVAVFTKILDAHIKSYRVVTTEPPELLIDFSTGWTLALREYGGYESFVIYAADDSFIAV